MTEHHDHRDDCPFKFATLDMCDCVEKNMLDRIEALTAKLAKAVEALELIVVDSTWGLEHQTYMKCRKALAAIKGESHE
jgi:hypothetical protein